MGWFLPMMAMMGAGAAGGLSSKLGMSKEKKPEPLLTPEQKAQTSASQALIPFYLQMMSGGMPDYLKRYLMQTQGALSQQARQGMSDYMRQVGGAGMDFGPQQAAQLGSMMQGITPALMQGLTQSRLGLTQGAMKGLQQWSTLNPAWQQPPAKQPSLGQSAGAGSLGAFGSFLGGKTGGGGSGIMGMLGGLMGGGQQQQGQGQGGYRLLGGSSQANYAPPMQIQPGEVTNLLRSQSPYR